MKRVLLIAIVLAACSGEQAVVTSTTGIETDSVPPASTVTIAPVATTGTDPTSTVYNSADPLERLPGSDGATGSGCVPGADALPDGIWFGAMESVSDVDVGFDLACWYAGEAANEAAAEDGFEEIPVPNDYYIRNEVDTLRTVPVAPEAMIHWYPDGGNLELSAIPWAVWIEDPEGFITCPGDSCIAWLYVNDGLVSEVVQQYTP